MVNSRNQLRTTNHSPLLVFNLSYTVRRNPMSKHILLVLAVSLAAVFTSHSQSPTPITNSLPIVAITATDPSASETGPDSGQFTVARKGDTNAALTVFLAIGGSAQNGVDYLAISNTITIPAGSATALITITPIDDNVFEGDEYVALHLIPPPTANIPTYQVGTPAEAAVIIHDNDAPPPTNHPPVVRITSPTNYSVFIAPVDITIFASAEDSDGTVQTVEFFVGNHSLGIATNNPLAMSPVNPFHVTWSNAPVGSYSLTARATDDKGASSVSAPVYIAVRGVQPPPLPLVTVVATDPDGTEIPVVPPGMGMPQRFDPAVFTVYRTGDTGSPMTVYYHLGGTAQNGVDYELLPNNVTIPAGAASAEIVVAPIDDFLVEGTETVEIALEAVACAQIIPAPPGCYQLGKPSTAVAYIHDNDTASPSNHPPVVRLTSPANGAIFKAPANIVLSASATDYDGYVASVSFFAGTNKIGQSDLPAPGPIAITNGPMLFYFVWSNVVAGDYNLRALATDNQGASSYSDAVHISVVSSNFPPPPPPTNTLPVVTIHARDSFAAEGTNHNTATLVVHRTGPTNSDLRVSLAIGGTASNGVDYQTIADSVVIPAGHEAAPIVIIPIDDDIPEPLESVIITLRPPATASLPQYTIGLPYRAAAVIADNDSTNSPPCRLPDGLFHVCLPASNGFPYRLECSTNLLNWDGICTNIVIDGAIHFVDPDSLEGVWRYYRALPEPLIAPLDLY